MGNQPSARMTLAHSPRSDDDEDSSADEWHAASSSELSTTDAASPSLPLSATATAVPRTDAEHVARPAAVRVPPLTIETWQEPADTAARDMQSGSVGVGTDAAAAVTPTRTNRRVEDLYEVQTQNIGRGHYAVVCRGKCRRTGRAVAIKRIKRFLTDEKRLRAEIRVMQRVKQHPNIVELLDVFETAREVQLVLELCTGGELFERLADKGPYSEADCGRHVRDMARAVHYLHTHGIVHRDLKPENILLSTPNDADAVIKVADFGLAKIVTGTSMKTKCGTWGYSAPEMISGSGIAFGYDCKVDAWSLGTILYILLCGYHPFDPDGDSSDNEMIANIKACRFDFDDSDAWGSISDAAKDLVRHLLVLDPAERFTMEQVLAHPWITGASAPPSALPLSPTIHRDLAKFRENSKFRLDFESFGYDIAAADDIDGDSNSNNNNDSNAQ